jgi:hypothetical protein
MYKMLFTALSLYIFGLFTINAAVCPDPSTSSLRSGKIPPPWSLSPFSENHPQAEDGSNFVKANILVAGFGNGVVCTYKNVIGNYSIWWRVSVKIPAPTENYWISILGGYVCTQALGACIFYPASEEDTLTQD